MVGGRGTTTCPVGKGALREAAVTSSEAKQKLGKDAAHETKYSIMPVSRSTVEAQPTVSSVLLPQETILILSLLGWDGKDCFCRQLYVLLTSGSGHSFDLIPLWWREVSRGACVRQIVEFGLTCIHFLRTSPAVCVVPCLVGEKSGKETS